MADENNNETKDEEVVSVSNEDKGNGSNEKGSSTNLDENIAGLLCYLGSFITGIIFLILEKKSNFVRFHAMQSIVFFGGIVVIRFLLDYIPFGGIINLLLGLLGFIMWIIFMVKAYQNEYFKFPITGQVAEDFANKQK